MQVDIRKTHVLAIAIIWFPVLVFSIGLDYTVINSLDDHVVLIGEVQNPKSLGNGHSSMDLVKASNPYLGQDYVNQTIPVKDLEVIVREGQTLAIHEVTDYVRFPVLHEPVQKMWQTVYVDGKLEWSSKISDNLFLFPGFLSIATIISVVSIVVIQRMNGKDPQTKKRDSK